MLAKGSDALAAKYLGGKATSSKGQVY